MIYTIENNELSVRISSLGAEVVSVKHNGIERSWQNENGSWSGHAPVLFPVCGNSSVIFGGEKFDMPFHGFARTSEFECVRSDFGSVCLVLSANEYTRKIYPFDFSLYIEYALSANNLIITYRIQNRSDGALYFSLGGHDSFALSENISRYKLVFPRKEKFDALLHDDSGRLTGEIMYMGEGYDLILPEELLCDGRTLIFSNIYSDKVTLCRLDGKKCVGLTLGGMSNLLLWRPNGAQMICIEPWMNLPDNAFDAASFATKCGVKRVEGKGSFELTRTIEYYQSE